MEVIFHEHPDLDNPILLASLPDMGQVGGLVPQFLIDHLDAKLFAEIHTQTKPYVLVKDGLVSFPVSIYKFYYSRKGDLIIMSGEDQPNDPPSLYALCNSVLDVSEKIGKLKRVYTAGGYSTEHPADEPRVYGVANMPHLFKELDRLGIREIGPEVTTITWFNGLILGLAHSRNIEGIGLYGEVDDPNIPQNGAARSVVKTIVSLLSLPGLDSRKKSADIV